MPAPLIQLSNCFNHFFYAISSFFFSLFAVFFVIKAVLRLLAYYTYTTMVSIASIETIMQLQLHFGFGVFFSFFSTSYTSAVSLHFAVVRFVVFVSLRVFHFLIACVTRYTTFFGYVKSKKQPETKTAKKNCMKRNHRKNTRTLPTSNALTSKRKRVRQSQFIMYTESNKPNRNNNVVNKAKRNRSGKSNNNMILYVAR